MKKELVIEMEEECITCPELSLETATVYGDRDGSTIKFHYCEHIAFCKRVHENWEKYHGVKEK